MDFNAFIGLPYVERGRDKDGCDCWGLVRLVLAERFGVNVPVYAEGYSVEDTARIEDEIVAARPDWLEIAPGDERPGDLILLRIFGQPVHIGLVIRRGEMLHTRRGTAAAVEAYRGPRAMTWRHRVEGFYRWRDLHA